MADNAKKWIAAAKSLHDDPTIAVLCPECEQASLTIQDVQLPDARGKERWLRCPSCGAFNTILYRNSDPA